MAKQLNVNLAVTANTQQARQQLQQLQQTLSQLMTNSANLKIGLDQTQLQQASKQLLELQAHLKQATNVDTGALDFTKLNNSIRNSGKTLTQYGQQLLALGPHGKQAFTQLAQSVAQSEIPMRRLSGVLGQFGTVLKNTIRWQLSSSLIHGFMGSIQQAYGYAQDLNKSLNNIQIVTGLSDNQMAKFAKTANTAAKALSTTTTKYTDAALIYYQQGIRNESEIKQRTDATIKMANVTGQSAEAVSNQMTAIWNNFADGSKNLEYYADVITALGAATASSSEEISQGLQKFAAVADTVGLSYENASAALATITATTRQSADTVGTGLRTLFSRLQSLSLGETLEDGVNLTKYSKALKTVGVDALDAQGQLRSMDDVLDDLGNKWSSLSKAQQVALAQTVGGVRQYTTLVALMDNFDFYKQNLDIAKTSEGTLARQQAIYEKSWEAAAKRVKASAESIYSSLIDDKFFTSLTSGFAKFLDILNNIIAGLGGMKGLLFGIGGLMTNVFNSQITQGIYSFGVGLKNLTRSQESQRADRANFINNAAGLMAGGKYNAQTDTVTNIPEKNTPFGLVDSYTSLLQHQAAFADNSQYMTPHQKQMAQIALDNETKAYQDYQQKRLIQQQNLAAQQNRTSTLINEVALSDQPAFIEATRVVDIATTLYNKKMDLINQTRENGTIDGLTQDDLISLFGVGFTAEDIKNWTPEDLTAALNDAQFQAGDDFAASRQAFIISAGRAGITKERAEAYVNGQQALGQSNFDVSTSLRRAKGARKTAEEATGLSSKEMRIASGITSVAAGAMQATAASAQLEAMGNALKQMNEGTLSAKDGITQLISSTASLGMNGVMAFQSMQKAMSAFKIASEGLATGLSLGLTAILILLPKIISAIDAAWETDAEKTKRLTEEADKATTAAQEAKTAYEKLAAAGDKFSNLQTALSKLTRGTQAFRDALLEANEVAQEIIEGGDLIYGKDWRYNEYGGIEFIGDAQQRAQDIAYQKSTTMQTASDAAQAWAAGFKLLQEQEKNEGLVKETFKLLSDPGSDLSLLKIDQKAYSDALTTSIAAIWQEAFTQGLGPVNYLTVDTLDNSGKVGNATRELMSTFLQVFTNWENEEAHKNGTIEQFFEDFISGEWEPKQGTPAWDQYLHLTSLMSSETTRNSDNPEIVFTAEWMNKLFSIMFGGQDFNTLYNGDKAHREELTASMMGNIPKILAPKLTKTGSEIASLVDDTIITNFMQMYSSIEAGSKLVDDYFATLDADNPLRNTSFEQITDDKFTNIQTLQEYYALLNDGLKTTETDVSTLKGLVTGSAYRNALYQKFETQQQKYFNIIGQDFAGFKRMTGEKLFNMTPGKDNLLDEERQLWEEFHEYVAKQYAQAWEDFTQTTTAADLMIKKEDAETLFKSFSIEDLYGTSSILSNITTSLGKDVSQLIWTKLVDTTSNQTAKLNQQLFAQLSSIDFTGNLIKDFKSIITYIPELKKDLSTAIGNEKGLFEALYSSEEFADSLEDIQKTIKKTGKLGADAILEMADSSEILSDFLEISGINAQSLSDILVSLSIGDINTNAITSGLLKAFSAAGELDNTLASVFNHIDTFSKDRSVMDIGKFYKGLADQIQESQEAGMLLDPALASSWRELFGEDSFKNYKEWATQKTAQQSNGSHLTPQEISDAFNKDYAAEIAAMQSIQKNGNLSGLYKYYFDKNKNEVEGLMHFDEKTGQVVMDNDAVFAERFATQDKFIQYLQNTFGVSESMANAMAAEFGTTNATAHEVWGQNATQKGIEALTTAIQGGENINIQALKAFQKTYGEFLEDDWVNNFIRDNKNAAGSIIDLGDSFDYANATYSSLKTAMKAGKGITLEDYLGTGDNGKFDVNKLLKKFTDLGFNEQQAKQFINDWALENDNKKKLTVKTPNGGEANIETEEFKQWATKNNYDLNTQAGEALLAYAEAQKQLDQLQTQAEAFGEALRTAITEALTGLTLDFEVNEDHIVVQVKRAIEQGEEESESDDNGADVLPVSERKPGRIDRNQLYANGNENHGNPDTVVVVTDTTTVSSDEAPLQETESASNTQPKSGNFNQPFSENDDSTITREVNNPTATAWQPFVQAGDNLSEAGDNLSEAGDNLSEAGDNLSEAGDNTSIKTIQPKYVKGGTWDSSENPYMAVDAYQNALQYATHMVTSGQPIDQADFNWLTDMTAQVSANLNMIDAQNLGIDTDTARTALNDLVAALNSTELKIQDVDGQIITIHVQYIEDNPPPTIDGNSNASGYNNASFAGGKHSNGQYEGMATVGELGPELWIHDGQPYLAGIHGRTKAYIHPNDQIYTATQTQKILKDNPSLQDIPGFSVGYNQVSWGTPSNADTSKNSTWEPERYHLITRQIKDLEREYERLSKIKDQAYGTNKLEAIKAEIAATQTLIEGQQALIDSTETYLKRDTEKLKFLLAPGEFELDEFGNIKNYDELQEKYKKKAKEDKDEEAQKVWDALEQYELTVDKFNEANTHMQELIYQEMDLRLETVTAKVDMKVNFDEREIKLLDHYIKRIDDNIYHTAEVLALTSQKLGNINQKINDTREGINGLFEELSDSEGKLIRKEDGSAYTMEEWLALSNAERDALDINSSFGEQLEEYMDSLLDYIEELEEFKTKGVEEFGEAFDELNDNVRSSIDLFDHYNQLLSDLKDITDLQGVKLSAEMKSAMKEIDAAMFQNTQNNIQAELDYYKTLQSDITDLRTKINNTTDESLKLEWEEQLKKLEEEARTSEKNLTSLWKTGLQQAKDDFERDLNEAVEDYETAIAGAYGSLDDLQMLYEKRKRNRDAFVPDFEKQYQITKLQTAITADLANQQKNGFKQSEGLKKLQNELNEAHKSGVKLSEYDLDIYSKRYNYEKALMDLEDSRNAKSQVRLQRDANGNWGYVYTSNVDEDELLKKQQAINDALYEWQKSTQTQVDNTEAQLLTAMTETVAKIKDLRAKGATDETIKEALALDIEDIKNTANAIVTATDDAYDTLGIAKERYQDAEFEITDSFSETLLSDLMGDDSIDGFLEHVTTAITTANEKMVTASNDYDTHLKAINDFFNESGEDLSTIIKGFASIISSESDENLIDSKEQIKNAKDTFDEILKVASDFEKEFINIYQPIIDENERLVGDLLTALHALNSEEYEGPKHSAGNSIMDIIGDTIEEVISDITADSTSGSEPDQPLTKAKTSNEIATMIRERLQKTALNSLLFNLSDKTPIAVMDTGGYTGTWGNDGRLAILHEKENVFSKDDTLRLLNAAEILRRIDLQADLMSKGISNFDTIDRGLAFNKANDLLEQMVTITAEFPNATNHSEIEEAFTNLINKASQYANRKGI